MLSAPEKTKRATISVAVAKLEYRKAEAVLRAAMGDGLMCIAAPADERKLVETIRTRG